MFFVIKGYGRGKSRKNALRLCSAGKMFFVIKGYGRGKCRRNA